MPNFASSPSLVTWPYSRF